MKGTRRTLRPSQWSRFSTFAPLAAALLLISLPAPVRAANELTVAAAADLQYAMRALIQAFERQSGAHVRLVLGSSGNLTAQIRHGAPFDLFFSADVQHPATLEREKLIEPGSLVRYAVGRLVVYLPKNSTLDLEHRGLGALTGPSVHKLAVANPRFAPYGRAAVAALRHAGLYKKLESRIVLGEDVAQTTQFVVSGNAQAALTALSLMSAPQTRARGRYWVVPAGDYPPLEQAAVIIGHSGEKKLAQAFLNFVETGEGRSILAHYGFAKPAPEKKR